MILPKLTLREDDLEIQTPKYIHDLIIPFGEIMKLDLFFIFYVHRFSIYTTKNLVYFNAFISRVH
jgi:hypothetical protein